MVDLDFERKLIDMEDSIDERYELAIKYLPSGGVDSVKNSEIRFFISKLQDRQKEILEDIKDYYYKGNSVRVEREIKRFNDIDERIIGCIRNNSSVYRREERIKNGTHSPVAEGIGVVLGLLSNLF